MLNVGTKKKFHQLINRYARKKVPIGGDNWVGVTFATALNTGTHVCIISEQALFEQSKSFPLLAARICCKQWALSTLPPDTRFPWSSLPTHPSWLLTLDQIKPWDSETTASHTHIHPVAIVTIKQRTELAKHGKSYGNVGLEAHTNAFPGWSW